jgi:hypothetical protein
VALAEDGGVTAALICLPAPTLEDTLCSVASEDQPPSCAT